MTRRGRESDFARTAPRAARARQNPPGPRRARRGSIEKPNRQRNKKPFAGGAGTWKGR